MVLATHAAPGLLPGGRIGVDIFFVLSGFLISSILFNDYDDHGSIDLKGFYIRRTLRLFPVLFCVIVFALSVDLFFALETKMRSLTSSLSVFFYFANWARVWETYHDMLGFFTTWWNGHLWSLSVEVQFYFVWPAAVLFILARRKPTFFFIILFAVGLFYPPTMRLMSPDDVVFQTAAFFRTDLRMDSLIWGALVAFAARQGYLRNIDWNSVFITVTAIAAAIVVLFLALIPVFHDKILFTLVAALTAFLVMTLSQGGAKLISRVLNISSLNWIGRISYGLYVYHIPIYYVVGNGLSIDRRIEVLLAIALSIIAAAASHRYVERPILKLKARLAPRL